MPVLWIRSRQLAVQLLRAGQWCLATWLPTPPHESVWSISLTPSARCCILRTIIRRQSATSSLSRLANSFSLLVCSCLHCSCSELSPVSHPRQLPPPIHAWPHLIHSTSPPPTSPQWLPYFHASSIAGDLRLNFTQPQITLLLGQCPPQPPQVRPLRALSLCLAFVQPDHFIPTTPTLPLRHLMSRPATISF